MHAHGHCKNGTSSLQYFARLQVVREKDQLERQLQQESHQETERLQSQLQQLRRDQEELARQLESEEESLTNAFQLRLKRLQGEKELLQRKLQEFRVNVVDALQHELEQERKHKTYVDAAFTTFISDRRRLISRICHHETTD